MSLEDQAKAPPLVGAQRDTPIVSLARFFAGMSRCVRGEGTLLLHNKIVIVIYVSGLKSCRTALDHDLLRGGKPRRDSDLTLIREEDDA